MKHQKQQQKACDTMQAEQKLYQAIATLKSMQEAKRFFQDLCTPAELQAMADRWCIVPHIQAGESYRKIHEKTGVSLTTIGRVARCLMMGQGGYHLIYERGKKANAKRIHAKRKAK